MPVSDDPSEVLYLSGTGLSAIYTDGMAADGNCLDLLTQQLHSLALMLVGAVYVGSDDFPDGMPGSAAQQAREAIAHAALRISNVRDDAAELSAQLTIAGQTYGWAESSTDGAMQLISDSWAWTAGLSFAPLIALVELCSLGGYVAGADDVDHSDEAVPPFDANERIDDGGLSAALADPGVVDLIGHSLSSADDLYWGSLGLGPVAALLGDHDSAATAAALGLVGGGLGMLVDGPVSVKPVRSQTTTTPTGFVQGLDRIPQPAPGGDGAQIVIERYEIEGKAPRFAAYIGGTVTFDPVAKNEPFDMASNVASVAGLSSASYRAVRMALADAGVSSASEVSFYGYSQGGVVAQQLAACGDYNTQLVVTIGSPGGQTRIPDDIDAVLIAHGEDIVPVLDGRQLNSHALLVGRDVFAGDAEPPQGAAVPAHHYEYYRHTAELLDAAESPQVQAAAGTLDRFVDGATTVTSTRYLATRVAETKGGGGW